MYNNVKIIKKLQKDIDKTYTNPYEMDVDIGSALNSGLYRCEYLHNQDYYGINAAFYALYPFVFQFLKRRTTKARRRFGKFLYKIVIE